MQSHFLKAVLSCVLATLTVASAQATSPPVPPPIAPSVGPQLSGAMLDLGLAFLRDQAANQNSLNSPYGISKSLGLVQLGVVGDAKQQLATLLQGGGTGTIPLNRYMWEINPALTRIRADTSLRTASRVWINAAHMTSKLPSYWQEARLYFQTDAVLHDFDNPDLAVSVINAWVKQQTLSRVDNMLAPAQLPPTTHMVFVNAVSFGGRWRTAFPLERTVAAAFSLDERRTVRVPTMHALVSARSAVQDGARWLELPYGTDADSEWVMQVALPPRSQSLEQFQQQLSGAQWQAATAQLQAERLRLALPRFSLKGSTISLRGTLTRLGVVDIFNDQENPIGLANEKRLAVDAVFHSAAFNVDETGTEGSADSAMDSKSVRSVQRFVVDRPFLFFIVHRPTGTPVLVGRVTNPASGR